MSSSAPLPVAPARTTARATLSVWAGARTFFVAWGRIVKTPSTWPLALVPLVIALAVLGTLTALGVVFAFALADQLTATAAGTWGTLGRLALRAVLAVGAAALALVVALSVAQPLSSVALEQLARDQDRELGGRPWPDEPLARQMLRSLRVTLTGLVLSLPILALLWLVTALFAPLAVITVPLHFLVTALVAAWDLLDYPMSGRGMGIGARLAWMRAHFRPTLGLGLVCAAFLLIPGFALILLPIGATAATRLVAMSERD